MRYLTVFLPLDPCMQATGDVRSCTAVSLTLLQSLFMKDDRTFSASYLAHDDKLGSIAICSSFCSCLLQRVLYQANQRKCSVGLALLMFVMVVLSLPGAPHLPRQGKPKCLLWYA